MSFSIVTIDDVPENTELYQDICIEAGFSDVCCFNDPVQAIREIKNAGLPDLIITDINMPGMKGTDVLKSLEEHFGGKLNAVVVTTDPVEFTGAHYPILEKGADFYDRLLGFLKGIVQ